MQTQATCFPLQDFSVGNIDSLHVKIAIPELGRPKQRLLNTVRLLRGREQIKLNS